MAKRITVTLSDPKEKKSVTRYDASAEGAAVGNIYIDKAALKKIGNPETIKLIIEADGAE